MVNSKLTILLERVATALERIANNLENGQTSVIYKSILSDFLEDNATNNEVVNHTEIIETKNNSTEEDVIEKFLSSKYIKIKLVPPEDASDAVINSLAEFLGTHYEALSELLAKIKSSMQRGGFITLTIKEYSQKDISDICQFCTRLHEIAFLEQYKYFRSPKYIIKAKTTTLSSAQNFFSGKWIERFVLLTIQKAVNVISTEIEKDLDFSYLINPQIILPNGDDFELDLIFHINGIIYWIEAKTGDFQQHISKYSKMSKRIGLDYKHAILVLPDILPEKSNALTSLYSLTVYGLQQLEIGLIEIIREDLNDLQK